jgi:heptosyltransferase III
MRILIVRPGAIGDTLLALPVIRKLREQYKNPHITFVGNAAVLPLALATGLVDEISDYEDVRWSALFSSAGSSRLSLLPVDMGGDKLVVTGRDKPQPLQAICWLRDPDGVVERNLRAAGVQQVIIAPGRPPENERTHIIEYLAQTIGMQIDSEHTSTMNREPTIVVRDDNSYLPPLYDLAIHPGSGGARKCWPVSSFMAVMQRLRQSGCRVLLLGGPADHERIDELRQKCQPPDILLDAPLLEVARYLRQCRRYLGNDSGITHLAALLGIPTIALFSASDPAVWHPVGPSVTILYAPRWEEITVDQVVENVQRARATARDYLYPRASGG